MSVDRIKQLAEEGSQAIAQAASTQALEDLRVRLLGRRAELPQLLRGVSSLEDPLERATIGREGNLARRALEQQLAGRQAQLEADALEVRLEQDRLDVTLPGRPARPLGSLHLVTQTRRELEDVFLGLGFSVAEGPEIESVHHNFDALNHAPTHPARARTDTFYTGPDTLLRTHTSPVQIRAMEAQPPPIYVIVPGRVYRRDSDATHTPQFHQLEGLAVDEDITLADLKGTLLAFAQQVFGDERRVLLRPHFFPFTEPSVEVDVSCFQCRGGYLRDGSRCNLCKGSGWLEVLGAGMVDPNVFAHVRESGYDPERVQGFAFGLGIERIAMLRHGIPDLRLFVENDLSFLEQF